MGELNLVQQARALTERGHELAANGRREEALGATRQAAEIYRQLAQADPRTFEPLLAGALINLGFDLVHLGRPEEALRAAEEAVEIHRGFGPLERATGGASYARAYGNLGWVLLELGDFERALTNTREAERVLRQLARADPVRFEPELGMALTNLSLVLFQLDRADQAAEVGAEALTVGRRLARVEPAARGDLARTLVTLSDHYLDSGRPDEGLNAAREAVGIYRELAEANPRFYEDALAGALVNLSGTCAAAGCWDEAVESGVEAIERQSRFAQPLAGIFGDLVRVLPEGERERLEPRLSLWMGKLRASSDSEEA